MNENDKFILRHGNINNKIRLLPQLTTYDPLRVYVDSCGKSLILLFILPCLKINLSFSFIFI